MTAYYNENDPFAAQWLRNLIDAGHIAPGDVDERSITEVKASELKQYRQCHLFAGIGVWSYALRQAGWPDKKRVWTGSCPCQPFSAAGQQRGNEDDRHLWPVWRKLIKKRKPDVIFGEQVSSAQVIGTVAGKGENVWLDIVQADLEQALYAVGAFDLPVAGFGGPHARHRVYFVADIDRQGASDVMADSDDTRSQGWVKYRNLADQWATWPSGLVSVLGNSRTVPEAQAKCSRSRRENGNHNNGHSNASNADDMAQSNGNRCDKTRQSDTPTRGNGSIRNGTTNRPGPVNDFWADADWIGCTDNRFRPVEPKSFPLVDGATQRVGRLRAYGNAISAPVAIAFIRSYMNTL